MPAPFPVAPQTNFINEIYSKKLLARFKEATILEQVTNTDYQGEISGAGSQVTIRHTPRVNNTIYTGTVTYAKPTLEDNTILKIDRARMWSILEDDIEQHQRSVKEFIAEATKDAAENLAIDIEKEVFGAVYADAGYQFNTGTANTALTVGKNDVIDLLVDVNVKFSELNIPTENRFIVLPAWACGMIRKSDLKDASITGDSTGVIRTGRVGQVDGLTIYSSNCLTSADGGIHAIAGIKQAVSFASQFVKNEQGRLESSFATYYRGLKVYGFKTVRPECLIDVLIKKA